MDDVLSTAPCGFLSSTDEGTIVSVNATLLNILDYQLEELQGKHLTHIFPVASRVFYQTHVLPLVKMHGKVDEVFLTLRTKSHTDVPVLLNVANRQNAGQELLDWVFMPMHRRSEYEDQLLRLKHEAEEARKELANRHAELEAVNASLRALAVTDGLTGLKNHRAFRENLGVQMALIERKPMPLSILLIDVDHFKSINDTYGHPIGDKYLIKTGQVLRDNSREGDFVARYGGEEFAIILPDTDRAMAIKVAEKFRNAIEAATWPERDITVSIGVSTLSPEMECDAGELIATADQALYLSKERGRNRVFHSVDLESNRQYH